jgi:hypothetical protein
MSSQIRVVSYSIDRRFPYITFAKLNKQKPNLKEERTDAQKVMYWFSLNWAQAQFG